MFSSQPGHKKGKKRTLTPEKGGSTLSQARPDRPAIRGRSKESFQCKSRLCCGDWGSPCA